MKAPKRVWGYSFTLSLTSALDKGGWLTSRPGRLTPGKRSNIQCIGGSVVPGPVCMGAENLVPTGIRSGIVQHVAIRYFN
jgi:hypothetical protein